MRSFLLALAVALIASTSSARQGEIDYLGTSETGVSSGALATTQTSSWMGMSNGDNTVSSQLKIQMALISGTSTRVQVRCKASDSASGGGWTTTCRQGAESGDPDACAIDHREYTITGTMTIVDYWGFSSPWVQCEFDDPDNGSGTVTVTASRVNGPTFESRMGGSGASGQALFSGVVPVMRANCVNKIMPSMTDTVVATGAQLSLATSYDLSSDKYTCWCPMETGYTAVTGSYHHFPAGAVISGRLYDTHINCKCEGATVFTACPHN